MSSGTEKIRDNLAKAIRACIDNAQRLHTETYDLEFRLPSATRYFLLIIAQEEAAKAFVLYLIKEGIVPLTSAVRRAINDHACKQLGSSDELPEHDSNSGEQYEASVVCEELVVSGCDAPELLQFIEETLDEIALLVERLVVGERRAAIGF